MKNTLKRVMAYHRSFFVLFLFLSNVAFASFEFENQLLTAHQNLFKLKISASEKILQTYKSKPNGIAIYLESFADGLRLVLNEEEARYKSYDDRQNERLARLDKLDKKDPYYLFVKSEMRFHSAFVKLKFGHEVQAAVDFRQSYLLAKENLKNYPSFAPSLKTYGLLSVIIGSIPERYMWVLNGFGLYGDVQKGMKQLEEAAASSMPFHLDADLALGILNAFVIKNEKLANDRLQKVYNGQKDNILPGYFYTSFLMKSGQAEKALDILNKMPAGEEIFQYHYLEFMKGEIYLQKAQYPEAITHYNKFLAVHSSNNYIKDSHYKIAVCYFLEGKQELADANLAKVISTGVARFESDKRAETFAEKKQFPNPILYKIRMATDGGFYKEAENMFNGVSMGQFKKHEDRVEYYYRKGRLKDNQGSEEEAIEYYHKAIEMSHADNLYYAPSACLYLGYIYMSRKDLQKAKLYFENVLFYKNHDYKNSLDNKAKAALDKLK